MQLKSINTFTVTLMLFFIFLVLSLSGILQFPSLSTSIQQISNPVSSRIESTPDPFTDLLGAFRKWDSQVGCARFREKHRDLIQAGGNVSASLQEIGGDSECSGLKMNHVSVLVKGWTWIPDNLDNLYSCRCGLSCLWTKSSVLADKPDALLFETTTPPLLRHNGDPLRIYMDLEAGRKRSGQEDIFISYHAEDDVQSTYAGALFHNGRNYYVSSYKKNDILVYWSSSRCLPQRNRLAKSLLQLLPYHSFGKCLNNVGGLDMALTLYPECANDANVTPKWWDHLHCAMSHYKFVLAIENTATESYVTEKLFYALDSGAVPIYFGAPNVMDFVPPHSIIDGTKFSSMEELASYVKALANNPVAYAEYHAWRRCGVLGNYVKTRAASLDTLPCRLCEAVSIRGGRNAGFAFVYFEDDRDAEVAIRGLDNIAFGYDRRRLSVEWARGERGRHRDESRSTSNQRPTKTLFVINFDPIRTRERDIHRHFEPYGKVLNVRIRRNFAFVQFATQEDATKALEATQRSKLLDRVVSVEYALRDDDETDERNDSPRRGSYSRRGVSPYGRSPSPYRRRPSPDYGRARSPARDRYNGAAPAYERHRSPDYGRQRSPEYVRYRSRSPIPRSRN